MAGGTLLVCKGEKVYPFYKKKLEALGFENVTVTGLERDALDMLIDELKPDLVIIGGSFYQSAPAYMIGCLARRHKGINMAIVSTGPFPPDIAMKCIVNGLKSFVYFYDGIEEFYHGLEMVRRGKSYVSPTVQERFEIRDELPEPSVDITERELEVLRCVRNGFTGKETAKRLGISLPTVNFHKRELYRNLGVRNENELIGAADYYKLIKEDEIRYYSEDYELSPKPIREKKEKRVENKERKIINWQQTTKRRSVYDH